MMDTLAVKSDKDFFHMKTKIPVGIKSIGRYLPKKQMNTVTGDGEKIIIHKAAKNDTTYRMGAIALENAITIAEINKEDLGHWLHCNDAPGDFLFQLVGRKILDEIQIGSCHTYNLYQSSNCSLLAIKLLIDHLRNDPEGYIGGVSSSNNWENHTDNRKIGDAVLGDGAAVLLLEKGSNRYCFDAFTFKTMGKYHDIAAFKVGGYLEEINQKSIQEGRFKYSLINKKHYYELKKRSVEIGIEVVEDTLKKAGISRNEIDLLVLHSQTPQISKELIESLKISKDSVVETVNCYGYMCSAGLLLSLHEAVYSRELPKNSKVLVTSIGIDGNWCAAIMTV